MRAVERLPSGRYKVRYRHGGRQTSQTWDKHADARRFATLLDAFRGDAQRALDAMTTETAQSDVPTMDTLAADHIRLLTGVEDGTRLTYRRLWDRTWGPHFGRLPANQLSRDDIAQATNDLARRYSAKSLKNQRGLLAAVCDRAVDLHYLPTNPTKRLRLPRSKETERQEIRPLTHDEFESIVDRIHPHYRPFVLFLGGMGCRYGEAVALQVQDVNLPDVRFRRALKWSPDNKRTVGPTKTRRSNRVVTAPPRILDLLPAQTEGKAGDALVFTAPRGGPIMHRTFWSDVWLPAVEHLTPRPRIHDLRHSFATWLLADGVPVHVVSRLLGHESIKTTVDVYGGFLPDARAAAARAISGVFGPRELT